MLEVIKKRMNKNKMQGCQFCFGDHFGLFIGMKYFDTDLF